VARATEAHVGSGGGVGVVVAPWQSELVVFLQCRRTAGYDSPVVSIILLKNDRVPN
jgi:hypothetical protein